MNRLAALMLLLLAAVPAPAALAKPITLLELREAFTSRGINVPQVAYLDGHPVMSGYMLGQNFEAILSDCAGEEKACESVRFVSCREMPGQSRIEALEIANTYNTGYKDGAAYADEKWFGQVVCLKMTRTFRDEEEFGLDQIFDWQITLEDFLQDMDDAETDTLAANVLDKDTD